MKNADEIFHNTSKVLNANLQEVLKYWTTVHFEEQAVCAANGLIFHRMYQLTKDERFKELEAEYEAKYSALNERALYLQSFVKED